MNEEKLALFGGRPLIDRPFEPYNSYGSEELSAARQVIASGRLSGFFGSWIPEFFGGEKVRAFESAWSEHFGTKYAVAVNSATSGLIAAVGAVGVEPGDEVIVTPLSMSATATSIVVWQGIPVFVDVERETFNIDPDAVEAAITPRTRAIVVADIFGHPADVSRIMTLANRYGLKVIEDAAQAPGAREGGRYAGTLGHIGVFSLNYHKHIHTGEGGMCVTDDAHLAERMRLIRNHAENVVGPKGQADLVNMIGFNFRMGEVEAAMGLEQLKKLDRLVASRQRVAERLTAGLSGLPGLRTPVVRAGCTHVYYVYPVLLDADCLPASKERIASALLAEGVPGLVSRFSNLHLLPMYQRRIAFGSKGAPWTSHCCPTSVRYEKGICPVAEDLRDRTLMGLQICMFAFEDQDVDLVIAAFRKVWRHLDQLAETTHERV